MARIQTVAPAPIVIVGAGEHGRVVLDACLAIGLAVAGFIDHFRPKGESVDLRPVLGGDELLADTRFVAAHRFVPGIGDVALRRRISLGILARGGVLAVVQHPAATRSARAAVGDGTVLCAGAVVNPGVRIGRFCIINTGASIDHDCVLDDGVQIAPGATLCGTVCCGADAFVGAGAVVLPGRRIGTGAVVGAGAVVTSNVAPGITVAGNPARPLATPSHHN
jgi:sugar O-acyltransferase (sialic acid O-acetyltransferase NeuD family)